MKKGIKKQLITGIAAVALVAPMILGGFSSNVHAANVPQAATSAQPANANNQSTKPKKTITMQQFKQMLAAQAAKQKKQMAKQMKGATTVFMAKGNEIYTVKAKGRQAFPMTMKKYMSVQRFNKVAKPKRIQLKKAVVRYRATHAKKYLRQIQKNIKYVEIAEMPTAKQQAKQGQQVRKSQSQSHHVNNQPKRQRKAYRHGKRVAKRLNRKATRKSHKRGRKINRKARRIRIRRRIKRSRRRVRKNRKKRSKRAATTFTVKDNGTKETLLKSKFKRGTWRQAKRTQFAKGPTLDKVMTLFDRYKPNDRRAIVPKRYKIIPDNTTWLVGRHTNNVNKINHMRNVYYYNKKFRGWSNIGYK